RSPPSPAVRPSVSSWPRILGWNGLLLLTLTLSSKRRGYPPLPEQERGRVRVLPLALVPLALVPPAPCSSSTSPLPACISLISKSCSPPSTTWLNVATR